MKNLSRAIRVVTGLVLTLSWLVPDCGAFSDPLFDNSTQKGAFGEEVTTGEMVKRGYEQLPSKYSGNNGIDHVFVKRGPDGEVLDIILAETKTDSSPYFPDQMSDAAIDERISKMKSSPDPEVRATAALLEKNRNLIRKEYWHHDTRTGKTTVGKLGPDGRVVQEQAEYSTERTQRKLKEKYARAGSGRGHPQGKSAPIITAENGAPVVLTGKPMPRPAPYEVPPNTPGGTMKPGPVYARILSEEIPKPAAIPGNGLAKAVGKAAGPVFVVVEIVGRSWSAYSTECEFKAGVIDQYERGKRHSMNTGSAVGGIGGGLAGGAAGSFGGPWGSAGGAVAGGVAGDYLGGKAGEVAWDCLYWPAEEAHLEAVHHQALSFELAGPVSLSDEQLGQIGCSDDVRAAYGRAGRWRAQ